jgi:hypothetical protein
LLKSVLAEYERYEPIYSSNSESKR